MCIIKVKDVAMTRGDNAIEIQKVATYSFWGAGNGLFLKLGGSIWVFTL